MLRISKLTDYATVVLGALAEDAAAPHSAAQLADATHIALPTVSKVLKALQRGGLVASTRGARGGYQLSRPAAHISAVDVIDAMEGPVGLTECATHPGSTPCAARRIAVGTDRPRQHWRSPRGHCRANCR
jgi:FeS assembly SUF system regulator